MAFKAPVSNVRRTLHMADLQACLCSTAAALDHALAFAFTHHWRVSYNKRARPGSEEERALSRVNGARHLTLSAPISAQSGAHASTAHARWASRDVGERRTALLDSLRVQRFRFSNALFPLKIYKMNTAQVFFHRFRHTTSTFLLSGHFSQPISASVFKLGVTQYSV